MYREHRPESRLMAASMSPRETTPHPAPPQCAGAFMSGVLSPAVSVSEGSSPPCLPGSSLAFSDLWKGDPVADPRTWSGPDCLPVGLPRVRYRPVRGVHLQKRKTPQCWLVCPFLSVPPWCPEPHGDAAPSVNAYVRTDGKVKGAWPVLPP